MNEQLKRMEQALSQEDRRMLQSVYEPQVVTIPPSDACCNMCVTSEGEIRIYGTMGKKEPTDMGTTVYLSSKDCGLSWKTHYMEHGVLGAATYNPETGRYIAFHPQEHRPDRNALIGKEGTWAILSEKGHDSADYRLVKMSEREVFIMRPPMYLKSCKRWLIIGEYNYPERVNKTIVVFYSDDDGESWTERELLPSAPPFVVKPPHKGPRWQQYSAEPTIAELVDGELVMFVRTSQDYYYTYRSADHGDHWTGPEPSPFHGTITMPVLQKLSDGRIVFFWCNTQPMPELDHTQAFPPLTPRELTGYSEDVFTNRDANHLAVTEDDMQSWIGLRELFLNPIRNNGDFRSIGGANSKDKSVHQAQMVELPYHKLLIHFGQNTSARKVVLLDVNWLYEQERKEDFRLGLQNVSTQMYVKSNMGNYRGWSGHCAYNRTQGALLVPDPSGNAKEVLQICRIEDERLVYKKQGAVWNFPASKKGRVEVELRVVKSGVALCLTDHWYNPADETVLAEAPLCIKVESSDGWITVAAEYDTLGKIAHVTVGGQKYETALSSEAPLGLSYLHIQSLAETEDQQGTLIRSFKKTQIF